MKLTSTWRPTILAAATLACLGSAQAATVINLQPDEASSKDVFVYEFGVAGVFNIPAPRVTNLDTTTLSALVPPPTVPFGNFLGAGETDPFTGPGGENRAHGIRSLLQFDLGFLALTAAQVGSATINLYALPALGAFESPTPDNAVTTDLRRVTGTWGETTVTWETAPTVAAPVVSSVTQDGVNRWVSFDATALVRDWLADPASNNGVELSQRGVVDIEVPGARDRYFASLYASSNAADAWQRPYLSVTAVPEPSTYALMLAGVGAVGWLARRRRKGT
jgi:PEP-CTERM motif